MADLSLMEERLTALENKYKGGMDELQRIKRQVEQLGQSLLELKNLVKTTESRVKN